MGKTIAHIAAVGGLAFPVIAEIFSLSQSHGFKWNPLSVLALVLLGLYVAYVIWYLWRRRGKGGEGTRPEPAPGPVLTGPKAIGNKGDGFIVTGSARLEGAEAIGNEGTGFIIGGPPARQRPPNELADPPDHKLET
jgi:hypothetical protein